MDVTVRQMLIEDAPVASELVKRVFEGFVKPDLEPGGWEALCIYLDPPAFAQRLGLDHIVLLAEVDGVTAGLAEIRHMQHVSLLVVDHRFFGKGIGRRLLAEAIDRCRTCDTELKQVTVHASRYAIGFYERRGFKALSDELVKDGVRFTPMAIDFD